MPWCPKCKNEYRKEITVCSDCKVELVEELMKEEEMSPFFQAEEKTVADKLISYFEYSGLKTQIHYDEENEVYIVSIPASKQKQAKKLYQAFIFVEIERQQKGAMEDSIASTDENDISMDENDINEVQANVEVDDPEIANTDIKASDYDDTFDTKDTEDTEESEEDYDPLHPSNGSAAYVMKADQFKDLSSTVWIFLLFGIVGLVIVILNVAGILNFLNGYIPNFIMSALFLFFIYVGISTLSKAKTVQTEIDAENKLTVEINNWLQDNITESYLSSIHDDSISDELNYIKKTDIIKARLYKEFNGPNTAYLERLIEEYYSSSFEDNEV